MRWPWLVLLLTGIGLVLPLAAGAAPGDGIAGTAHDFSGRVAAMGPCTFCHTPHSAQETALGWNRSLSPQTYSWDKRSTAAGTVYPTIRRDTYKGPTAKCLGCHDGSVAVSTIAWRSNTGSGSPLESPAGARSSGFKMGASSGSPGNMAGNHPVAMPYPFGGRSTYNGVTTGDHIQLSAWEADPELQNIRLYHDDGSGFIAPGARGLRTGIECSSCHDPHNKASVDGKFLRGRLGGTGTDNICMKCHMM